MTPPVSEQRPGTSPSDLNQADVTPSTRGVWQPRTADIRRSVEKYSRFVSLMKIILPGFAILLVALVIILPQMRDVPDDLSADIVVTPGEAGDSLSLVNARYFGTDDSGQPFSVTAQSVREGETDRITLDGPQADISLNDGTWLMVGADNGLYHRETQVLDLEGAVNLFQDQGYELHTDAATVLLKQGQARSSTPVRSQGPFGRMESQGFELEDKGKTLHFTGPAKLVLNSGAGGAAAP
jgi:lipopolysaccharide export system protein LptC